MANKKISLSEKLRQIDEISEKFNNQKEVGLVGRLSQDKILEDTLKIECIPTPSFNLNAAIGGGFPRKAMSIISGLPDSGKTGILLETIALQQKKDPSFIALWLESENSLNIRMLDMFGIDKERFVVINHDRKGAGESALDKLESIISTGYIDMAVINSLACIIPSEEYNKSLAQGVTVATQARLNSRMVRRLTSTISNNNVALVIVQHLSTAIGTKCSYGVPMDIKGGQAIKYASLLTLDFRKKSIGEKDPITPEQGMKIKVSVKKNHIVVDRYPYVSLEYFIIYGQGVEIYFEIITLALHQGILRQKGAFFTLLDDEGNTAKLTDGSDAKWRGKNNVRDYFITHPEDFEALKSRVTAEYEEIENVKEDEATGEIDNFDEEVNDEGTPNESPEKIELDLEEIPKK